uniref:Uncharacterized protein n=1 Tax=Rhizophora mucronata TaxID=61149 RepID=A0A2P2M9Y3_RHIMU
MLASYHLYFDGFEESNVMIEICIFHYYAVIWHQHTALVFSC